MATAAYDEREHALIIDTGPARRARVQTRLRQDDPRAGWAEAAAPSRGGRIVVPALVGGGVYEVRIQFDGDPTWCYTQPVTVPRLQAPIVVSPAAGECPAAGLWAQGAAAVDRDTGQRWVASPDPWEDAVDATLAAGVVTYGQSTISLGATVVWNPATTPDDLALALIAIRGDVSVRAPGVAARQDDLPATVRQNTERSFSLEMRTNNIFPDSVFAGPFGRGRNAEIRFNLPIPNNGYYSGFVNFQGLARDSNLVFDWRLVFEVGSSHFAVRHNRESDDEPYQFSGTDADVTAPLLAIKERLDGGGAPGTVKVALVDMGGWTHGDDWAKAFEDEAVAAEFVTPRTGADATKPFSWPRVGQPPAFNGQNMVVAELSQADRCWTANALSWWTRLAPDGAGASYFAVTLYKAGVVARQPEAPTVTWVGTDDDPFSGWAAAGWSATRPPEPTHNTNQVVFCSTAVLRSTIAAKSVRGSLPTICAQSVTDGEDGADGAGYERAYAVTADSRSPAQPANNAVFDSFPRAPADGPAAGTVYDNYPGVSEALPFGWVTKRSVPGTPARGAPMLPSWGDWTPWALHEHFGIDGVSVFAHPLNALFQAGRPLWEPLFRPDDGEGGAGVRQRGVWKRGEVTLLEVEVDWDIAGAEALSPFPSYVEGAASSDDPPGRGTAWQNTDPNSDAPRRWRGARYRFGSSGRWTKMALVRGGPRTFGAGDDAIAVVISPHGDVSRDITVTYRGVSLDLQAHTQRDPSYHYGDGSLDNPLAKMGKPSATASGRTVTVNRGANFDAGARGWALQRRYRRTAADEWGAQGHTRVVVGRSATTYTLNNAAPGQYVFYARNVGVGVNREGGLWSDSSDAVTVA